MKTRSLNSLLALSAITLQFFATAFAQGPLAPPAGAPVASMKTLDQIEPRIVIPGGAAFVITQPGSYVLGGNIAVTSGNAITIQSPNVTLDLGGYTLSSSASPASGNGIALNGGGNIHVTILNGHIRGTTGYGGVFIEGGFTSGINYQNLPLAVQVRNVSVSGVSNTGINLGTDPSTSVIGCTVRIAGTFGIRAGVVADSSATIAGVTGVSATTVSNSVGTLGTGVTSITSTQPTVANLAASLATLQSENATLKNLVLSSAQASGALTWEVTPFAATLRTEYDEGPSLAITPGGQPAMAFSFAPYDDYSGDARIIYAVLNGSTWQLTDVDATVGRRDTTPSLNFTPDGKPAIAYNAEGRLAYAVYSSGSWNITLVGNPDLEGYSSSLAFTPGGQPAIAFCSLPEPTSLVQYAVFNGTTWQVSTVDTGPFNGYATGLSLKFTPGGQPAIAYRQFGTGKLRYAVLNGSTWQISPVVDNSTTGSDPSLAFTPTGQPAIAYVNGGLMYAVLTGGTWVTQTVDLETPIHPSLAFSPGGQPAIAYGATIQNPYHRVTRLATSNGLSWRSVDLPGSSDGVETVPSLVFTPDGQPAVAYSEGSNRNLRYAVRTPFAAP
jgi:hypothetical protein